MKIKGKMKNKSHRYNTNRYRSRHGRKYTEYNNSIELRMPRRDYMRERMTI